MISVTVMETTWYKKILGVYENFSFCLQAEVSMSVLYSRSFARASPFLWEYHALTFHICSAFSKATKVPANMLLFFFTSSAFTGVEINSSSREKEKRKREGRGRNRLLQYWVLRNLVFLETSC